ncbi:hypothetical protein [Leptolyngbya sp. FACHB-261]|uniref:hypothetical protein n=1 Tax=Leptolyngbya sp. FACHB-261 TaxID=2692806 RepID=UPI001683A198|nr:hypothetical protein [Leptolyngbya sp. FACHB-261]MBD2099745.1 hypothetical protein [Leptolyngbya sp. FACHB-261]
MGRKLLLWLIWLGFIVYVLLFAPPVQPDTFQPLQTLLSGQIPTINPVIVSLFSLVGIWLLIYSCLTFADGRMQRVPAWAFMLASVATGVLGLIPYLALREPNQSFSGHKDTWLKWLDSRSTGLILAFSTIVLLAFALFFGDWSAFSQEFQTNRFVHAMSLAFLLFCFLFPFPTLLSDDMARRGLSSDSQLFRLVAFIPLFGPLAYLCLRPPLLGAD